MTLPLTNTDAMLERYFDGLGRPLQTVNQQASPSQNDVVQPVVYDAFGRESRKYLPFVAESNGYYKPHGDIIDGNGEYKGIAQPFYAPGSNNNIADDAYPYADIVFEPSPLNRVIKQGAPGSAWRTDATNSYQSTTYIASHSITLQPGYTVPSNGTLTARLGYSQQEADAYNSTLQFAQEVDFRYNIRGWLDNINEVDAGNVDLFSLDLNYNNPVANGGAAQHNGNISQAIWKGPDGQVKSYGYSYDALNRLKDGLFYSTGQNGRYSETIGNAQLPGYDLNGNILNLFRSGKKVSAPAGDQDYGLMDGLAYVYNGNQLKSVTDAAVDTEGFKDGANNADDYAYDVNGNLNMDMNKGLGANSITYNHLNLPQLVQKSPTEYVQYTYDAGGRKLRQVAVEAGITKTTDYVGALIYENNVLQFINHEEGRAIMTGSTREYQYHLKDHLGNVRVTFTTKPEVLTDLGTLETANETPERSKFLKYDDIRKVNYAMFDHTNTGSTKYAMRLTGTEAERYGLARSLLVFPGDKVKAEVFGKYVDLTQSDVTTAVQNLISQIVAGTATAGTVIDGATYSTPGAGTIPFGGVLDKGGETGTAPMAYLNWLVFDKDYNPVLSKCGYQRLSTAARENGALAPEGVSHELLQSPEIEITEAGYVYIYLSNEAAGYEVYFDDFEVEHTSAIVQSEDYYPFGLAFNSYGRENSVAENYKYNGKEEQTELGLGWLDYGWRMYSPELGRFSTLDPVAGKFVGLSPYSYCADNPVLLDDPDGRDWSISARKDKKGQWQITFTFTGAVLNSSGRNINTANYINQQKAQFRSIFAGVKGNANVSVNFNVRSIDSKSDLNSNDHLIEIQDRSNFADREGGNAAYGGKHIQMNERFINDDGTDTNDGDARSLSHEIGHTGGLWHPFKGKGADGKYYDGFDEKPNNMRFANGNPSNANSQRDVEYSNEALANDYQYANNFMTYIMYAQKRLMHTPDKEIRTNPGKASPGQIYQILFNYKQGNLNYNDIPK